ncbi:RNA-directed DNA methylation 4-like isoform X1 [Oryza brachyantha]|uniref:RNA-directed DNA methylation 4-like isoform X1 n=1 Tax=Oryza brachyantha TaxID=4533 RepID=UPI001ADC6BA6|nr:RNA-directed DNA methylation 4-like isoform X1 [Oryza brachyantha]
MASTSEAEGRDKPIVVRVKRKPSQTRPNAFWLEINERPVKKAMLDFSSLSVSEPSAGPNKVSVLTASEEPRVKKLLVQHIETVHHSEAVQDVLHSLLHSDLDAKEIKSKTKEWNNRTKQDRKQDQLRSAARQRHEDLGRNARFAQIWRSRKGDRHEVDESLREICHLYDAVQVDSDEEKHPSEPRITSFEEGAILCNFLPLIREHLPSAAEEIESDIISLAPSEDSDVYDIYTVKEVDDTSMGGTSSAPYPLLQVDDDCGVSYDDDDPYDTDDSNAEDNPLYDYPEELSEGEDDGSNSENPFSDIDGSDPEYEKEEVEEENDEDGR